MALILMYSNHCTRQSKGETTKALGGSTLKWLNRPPTALRDLLEFRPGDPVALEEVEPVETIFPRFTTAGMSLGALSREAHEILAIAMNRIGARSNSGEGGESRARYRRLPSGDWANSATKQVASA